MIFVFKAMITYGLPYAKCFWCLGGPHLQKVVAISSGSFAAPSIRFCPFLAFDSEDAAVHDRPREEQSEGHT